MRDVTKLALLGVLAVIALIAVAILPRTSATYQPQTAQGWLINHMVNEWYDDVIKALGTLLRQLTDEEADRLDSPDELPSVLRMTLGETCFRVYQHGGGTLILAIWDSMELSRNGEACEPTSDNLLALSNCGSYRGLATTPSRTAIPTRPWRMCRMSWRWDPPAARSWRDHEFSPRGGGTRRLPRSSPRGRSAAPNQLAPSGGYGRRATSWGKRDPNLNQAHPGRYMVAHPYEPGTVTWDGGDGVFCIVGDDLGELVTEIEEGEEPCPRASRSGRF